MLYPHVIIPKIFYKFVFLFSVKTPKTQVNKKSSKNNKLDSPKLSIEKKKSFIPRRRPKSPPVPKSEEGVLSEVKDSAEQSEVKFADLSYHTDHYLDPNKDPYISRTNLYLDNDYADLSKKIDPVIIMENFPEKESTDLAYFIPPLIEEPTDTKSVTSKGKFRLSSKKLFLTYPQTENLSLQMVLDHIKNVLGVFGLRSWLLVSEDHSEDTEGKVGKHIHVFLKFEKKVDVRNQTLLHVNFGDLVYKGSYESARSEIKCLEYCLKDVFDAFDTSRIIASPDLALRLTKLGALEKPEEAMIRFAEQGKVDIALMLLRKFKPEKFVKDHMLYEKSFRSLHYKKLGFQCKFDLSDFEIPVEMSIWLEDLKIDSHRKTAFLVGSSGCGKSRFLETYVVSALKLNPLIINNIHALSNWKEGFHTALIFDDCSFASVDREQLIKFLDSEYSADLRILYQSVRIGENIPRFIASNKTLDSTFSSYYKDPAIVRRVSLFHIVPGIYLYKLNKEK